MSPAVTSDGAQASREDQASREEQVIDRITATRLGRLDGSETGSICGGGGGGGSSFGGAAGVFRLFQSEFGGQVSRLMPTALISLGALLWISRRGPRTSRVRSFALLWGGWLLVTGVVFSYMEGIIHPYYMVALAPAIGALVGVGAISLLQSGLSTLGRAIAAIGVLVTGIWAYQLLERTPGWLPWLRWTILLAGVLGAISVFAVPELLRRADRNQTDRNQATAGHRRRVPALVHAPMALAIVAGPGGPLAYSLDTASSAHTGSIPSAGPAVAGSFGGGGVGAPGGAPGGGFGGGFGGRTGTGSRGTGTRGGFPGGSGSFPGGSGSFPGGSRSGTGTGTGSSSGSGTVGSRPGGSGRGTAGAGGFGGGVAMGGLPAPRRSPPG